MQRRKLSLCIIILITVLPIGINNSIKGTNSTRLKSKDVQMAIYPGESKVDFQQKLLTQSDNNPVNYQPIKAPSSLKAKTSVNTSKKITGFISTWKTDITDYVGSGNRQIHLPLESNGKYNFNVSWGDGSNSTITVYNQPQVTHTYKYSGTYTLNITGTIIGWAFNLTSPSEDDAPKLIQISNWGPLRLGNGGYNFVTAYNLVLTANDALNLKNTTNLAGMFADCNLLGSTGNLNSWNVVTNMRSMFAGDQNFNQPLNSWDVSHVTDMSGMFLFTNSFNQLLNSWKVSHVTDMSAMFDGALIFNHSLNSWDVSHVTDMSDMFGGATSFNQPLNSWDVSQVTDMSNMFDYASSFNQPLGSWNVSRVIFMSDMFAYASSFNQPLGSWNVSRVASMASMLIEDTLSVQNYDQLLLGWSSLPKLQPYEVFNAGKSEYSTTAQNARNKLLKTFKWKISDGGLVSSANPAKRDDVHFNQVIQEGFTIYIVVLIIAISFFLSIYSLQHRKNKKKTILKVLNFWFYLKNNFSFKKHKLNQNETLNPETLNKIEEIINENKK